MKILDMILIFLSKDNYSQVLVFISVVSCTGVVITVLKFMRTRSIITVKLKFNFFMISSKIFSSIVLRYVKFLQFHVAGTIMILTANKEFVTCVCIP